MAPKHVPAQPTVEAVIALSADLSPAVLALEKAYARLQKDHPDVPNATIVVKRDERAWGHTTVAHVFGPQGAPEPDRLEIMISAENLARGARSVAATLIHEAAHGRNLAQGILDSDVNGRHNRAFADSAEHLGLVVAQAGWRGWTDTTLDDQGAARHRVMLNIIERGLAKSAKAHAPRALKVTPTSDGPEGTGATVSGGETVTILPPRKRGNRNLLKATCACGFNLRISQGALDGSRPKCSKCRQVFKVT